MAGTNIFIGESGGGSQQPSGVSSWITWGIVIAALAGVAYLAYTYLSGQTSSAGLLSGGAGGGGFTTRNPSTTTTPTTPTTPTTTTTPTGTTKTLSPAPASSGGNGLTTAQEVSNERAVAETTAQNARATAAENAAIASPGPKVNLLPDTGDPNDAVVQNLAPGVGEVTIPAPAPVKSTPAPASPNFLSTIETDIGQTGTVAANIVTAPVTAAIDLGSSIVNDLMGWL